MQTCLESSETFYKISLSLGDPKAGQYVMFAPLTRDGFEIINRHRNTDRKGLLFMYLEGEEALIVKIPPGLVYAIACNDFLRCILDKVAGMGLDRTLADLRKAPHQGIRSLKEADSVFRPRLVRPSPTDWPTLVIESGIHISLKCLRADCRWWLENSMGEVKIVLLLSISEAERKIHLEQWEIPMSSLQVTQANRHFLETLTKTR